VSEEVRAARPEDLARCHELIAQATHGLGEVEATPGEDPRPDRSSLLDEDRLHLVGIYEGEIVGLAVARLDTSAGERVGVVEICYVEPAARGVGVGESLLEALAEWVSSRGGTGTEARARPGDRETKRLLEAAGFKTRLLILHRPSDHRRAPARGAP
jgi:GNAT superfamily N-acetyltransferase